MGANSDYKGQIFVAQICKDRRKKSTAEVYLGKSTRVMSLEEKISNRRTQERVGLLLYHYKEAFHLGKMFLTGLKNSIFNNALFTSIIHQLQMANGISANE